jgi:hypothetical protein
MFYDVESRIQVAHERAELLRAQAERRPGGARRWLSQHLISAGMRLAPERTPRRRRLRAA